ncbi:MAG: DUF4147 domain-containing protein, partial [Pirellulales bacterium]|nr:DUF4147 domain-containing protein [Pirellulales bacterium]
PAAGVSLSEKQFLARELAARGADIRDLNTVRKRLSRIKGGGLARACQAGRLITLMISDVLGDPLDVIASGPTVQDAGTSTDALDVLTRFQLAEDSRIAGAVRFLRAHSVSESLISAPVCQVTNIIIGNNATAVDAAGQEAVRRGYHPACIAANEPEGPVEAVAAHLAYVARQMRAQSGPDCLISGGEPTVTLAPESERGLGGRNQQLALAALIELAGLPGVLLLSAGTDGEDGPTDAAGAVIDDGLAHSANQLGLEPKGYLARNDAYHFFEPLGGLIKTGPTHTNVCDVRVVLIAKS